jgi:N-acetylmuramoyl-L-alanine amidase
VTERASPNFNDRGGAAVELVVLHYTGMADGASALARLCDPRAEVSAHYLVDEAGGVTRLVAEDKRAWHAGRGSWRGRDDVNSRSIGIEIVNGGHDFGLPPYPDAQIEAVTGLVRGLLGRWGLAPGAVIGHSDLAPGRKQDPGEHFPWERLAAAGAALEVAPPAIPDWPTLAEGDAGPAAAAMQAQLAAIGYTTPTDGRFDLATASAVAAFQRRWRRARVDGRADAATRAWIAAVALASS